MSKNKILVRSARERHIAQIPVDKIDVPNPRRRDEERFKETVRSISEVGLQKPICLNERNFKKTGRYELVCGEGRLAAHRQLGKAYIDAEIINVDEGDALLKGLAENLTRARKDIMDFARRILEMHDKHGKSYSELAAITGKSESTMRNYIELMQKGEERLIRGVENDIFTIDFAMKVIQYPQSDVQSFLMDEYQNGKITTRDLEYIRKILEQREAKGLSNTKMTHMKLTASIREETKRQKLLYAQHKIKRNDALCLRDCLKLLWEDETFNKMVEGHKELTRPEIKGQYGN